MTDLDLERAFANIELVTGSGTRETGRMCIMSMVSCLAGERHTDAPFTASPLIRAFVIPINDNMPHAVRQRLKPFAPRIIGTADGLDQTRTMLLRRALVEEILPLTRGPQKPIMRSRITAPLSRLWDMIRLRRLEREAETMLDRAVEMSGGYELARSIAAAGSVGRMLARAARETEVEAEADRLWNLSISLIDRLCDVGREQHVIPSKRDMIQRVNSAMQIAPT